MENIEKRIEIAIGDTFIFERQRYRCVKTELQSCSGCAFDYASYEPCEILQCTGSFRSDGTDVYFIKAE